MNFKRLFATSSLAAPTLAVAHDSLVSEINGIMIKSTADLAYVHRRLPLIGTTFIPPAGRDGVNQSLLDLHGRVAAAGRLPTAARDSVKRDILKTIEKINDQPEKMAHTQNGAGELHLASTASERPAEQALS